MKYSLIFLLPLAVVLSGCVPPTDFEYDQKVAASRMDCKGDEIVGVWVSLSKGGMSGDLRDKKMTLLIRSDGSGMQKLHRENGDDSLVSFRCQYRGYGNWSGTMDDGASVRFFYTTGGELAMATEKDAFMRHGNNAIRNYYVCVRASDAAAVDQHLRARQ